MSAEAATLDEAWAEQGTTIEEIRARLAAGYPAKSQTASLMLAVADVSALLAVLDDPAVAAARLREPTS